MKALLVIDAQHAIVDFKDITEELDKMEKIITNFIANRDPVIFIRNVDDDNEEYQTNKM